MSKTTPVRWWRDDATRYHRRPPYRDDRADEIHRWAMFDGVPPGYLTVIAGQQDDALAQANRRMLERENCRILESEDGAR